MAKKERSRYLCLSYVPFLTRIVDVGKLYVADEVLEQLDVPDDCQEQFSACLWAKYGSVVPILISDRPQELYDDMMFWSEGKPGEWFCLAHDSSKDHYELVLFPDVEKSLARFRLRLLMMHDTAVAAEDVEVIAMPPRFDSEVLSPHFLAFLDEKPERVDVGLADKRMIEDPNTWGIRCCG